MKKCLTKLQISFKKKQPADSRNLDFLFSTLTQSFKDFIFRSFLKKALKLQKVNDVKNC